MKSLSTTLKPAGLLLYFFSCFDFFAARQTFFADPFVQEHVRLDAVVCLCDSPRLLRTLVAPPPPPPPPASAPVVASAADGTGAEGSALAGEGSGQTSGSSAAGPAAATAAAATAAAAAATLVMSQLALSDRVLLNKSDLITPAEVSEYCSTFVVHGLDAAFALHPFGVVSHRRLSCVWCVFLCSVAQRCPVGARTMVHDPCT